MRTKPPPMWDYLRSYRQDQVMLWIWRIIMAMTLFNGCIGLLNHQWADALTDFVIAAFIYRIITLERYITHCNELRADLEHELKDKE